MEEIREFAKRCLTADRAQQLNDVKRLVESMAKEPSFIETLKSKMNRVTPLGSTERDVKFDFYINLDGRLMKYLREETVLVEDELKMKWESSDPFIVELNRTLGFSHIRVESCVETSYSTDDGSYQCLKFACIVLKLEKPPQKEEVDPYTVRILVKVIRKSIVAAAFFGIPQIRLIKRDLPTWSLDEINLPTLQKIQQVVGKSFGVGKSFEITEKGIKIDIDPSKVNTSDLVKFEKKLTRVKETTFDIVLNKSSSIIRIIKHDIRRNVSFKGVIGKESTYPGLPVVSSACPEIQNAIHAYLQFTPEEEDKLNSLLGLKGFKMKILYGSLILEYPPDFVSQE